MTVKDMRILAKKISLPSWYKNNIQTT
jgi:hypothetical protein